MQAETRRLAAIRVQPTHPLAVDAAAQSGQNVPSNVTLEDLLRRPHVHYPLLMKHGLGACQLPTTTAAAEEVAGLPAPSDGDNVAGAAAPGDGLLLGAGAAEAAAELQEPLSVAEYEAVEINIKYSGFIHRQAKQMRQVRVMHCHF